MARVQCNICNTRCVGCHGGRCRCPLSEATVVITNALVEEYNLHTNPGAMANLIRLAQKSNDIEYLRKELFNFKLMPAPIPEVNEYCEFPIGSGNKGARVECINCGEPRFRSAGKKCKSFITE